MANSLVPCILYLDSSLSQMPRKYSRKGTREKYDPEKLKLAIDDVTSSRLTRVAACKQYGLNVRTLRRYLNQKKEILTHIQTSPKTLTVTLTLTLTLNSTLILTLNLTVTLI